MTGMTPFAQTPQHIHAIGIGKSEIEQDTSGRRWPHPSDLRGGFGLMYLIVSRFQNDAKQTPNLHSSSMTNATGFTRSLEGSRIGSPRGRRMEKRAPPPSRFRTTISPECASIN